MERLVLKQFEQWKKSPSRKPLVLFGARQIGKTYVVLDFGSRFYQDVVYCNFEQNKELSEVFERNLEPERIIATLSALKNIEIRKETSLIFFDEIQACEKALSSLKYFCEQANDYHIIAAGSFLGLAVNRNQFSFPVGKVDMINMYPLDFEEFLMATDNQLLINMIRESYSNFSELPSVLHEKALDLYRYYLVIGGYPEAVKTWLEQKNFDFVQSVQSTISNAYLADMSKYANPSETIKSMAIFNSISSQLAKENTKFQYAAVNAKARSKDYELSLEWLKASRVVLSCVRVSEGKHPLALYEDSSAFKIYYSDVGLLSMRFSSNPNSIIHNKNLSDKARGMLAENYVAEQFVSMGKSLHYWTSGNQSEVDFIIQDDDETFSVPVEVKSAENVKAKSLQQFVKLYAPKYSIRISARNFGFENNIKSIPLYAIFCMKK